MERTNAQNTSNQYDSQIRAIKMTATLGRRLQLDHPEIVSMIRLGKGEKEIAKDLDIARQYGVSFNIARLAVGKALRGNNAVVIYSGLMDLDDLESIMLDQKSARGERLVREKKGWFALTDEQKKRIARKSGKKSYRLKRGFFALTREEREEIGRAVGLENVRLNRGIMAQTREQKRELGINLALSQGKEPWVEEKETEDYGNISEIDCMLLLYSSSAYTYQKGPAIGKPNLSLIAQELNRVYHNGQRVRTDRAVRSGMYEYRKSQR